MLSVTILGNNSALPAYDRHPTAQVVDVSDQLFLVDCGEGTQLRLVKYAIRWSRIGHIFISHLHGDHYFGLPGLLSSMGLLNRKQELHLYGPPELQQIIHLQFEAAGTILPFDLHFHPLTEEGELFKNNKVQVTCFKTEHRVTCWGFRFNQVKPPRKVDAYKAREAGIPETFFDNLKWGHNYSDGNGVFVPNEAVTIAGVPPKSYGYCADTRYFEALPEKVKGVSLLYHEATYLQDLAERAVLRFHSTTADAARVAIEAGVGKLLIGHFSSKYGDLTPFENEVRSIFQNAELALEGTTYWV